MDIAVLSQAPSVAASIRPELLLGLMFVTALIGGYVAHAARAPKILGYLLGGVALKQLVAWMSVRASDVEWTAAVHAADKAVRGFTPLSDLALGMILFILGTAFDAKHFRAIRRFVWKLTLAESGLTLVLVGVGSAVVIGLTGGAWTGAISLGLLLGAAAVATAPATTLLVLDEYEAKGPTTDTLLALTGLNCMWSIILFHAFYLILTAVGALPAGAAARTPVWLDLVLTTAGSVLLGLLLGVLVSWLTSTRPLGETLLFFFAAMLALGAGGQALRESVGLSFSILLTSLVAGAAFANIAINPERFDTTIRAMGAPLFAAFFVLAGYQLHLDMVAKLGLLGIAYAAFRVIGKIGGVGMGVGWARTEGLVQPHVGMGLLAQAGVAIGLANFLIAQPAASAGDASTSTPLAASFFATILGSVALFEIAGPLATKWVAVRSGEVKAIHLTRREDRAGAPGASTARVLIESALRLAGVRTSARSVSGEALTVADIMRTNVKCLNAGDSFDDVLRFLDQSRFNHFPVVDSDNRLVGVIHFSDIRQLSYDPGARNLITAVDLADVATPAALLRQPLSELREVFQEFDVGALPVIDSAESRKVVGLVEQRDLLAVLHKTAAKGPGGKH